MSSVTEQSIVPAANQVYAAIDLETTGLKANFDEIIEVGIVRCTPDRELERWDSLVRPLEMPSLSVQRMTRITPTMLAEAPTWAEVEHDVRRLLDGATLIGHSVQFDEDFLKAVGITSSAPSVDTLALSRIIDPTAPTHRLGDLCKRYGIELRDHHRALADAEAARQMFLTLRKRFERLPLRARDALTDLSSRTNLFWGPGRVLREWSLDTPRTESSEQEPNRRAFPPLEPIRLPQGSLAELTAQAFASVNEDGFEERTEQLSMARDVAETLQHGGNLIVEAGTGTGKSLAYLVPAALWALKTGNTVVISTHTINLQQQLANNDIEFARQLIAGVAPKAARSLKATVIKGRDNYLCQRLLDHEIVDAQSWDDPDLLGRVAVWRNLTERGDVAELRLPPEHRVHWPKFSAAQTNCISDPTCQYAEDGSCFIVQTQLRAQRSHIVIANHALLVRGKTTGSITFPPSAVTIIDESHELEDVATDQLSVELSEDWMMEVVMKVAEDSDSLAERADRLGMDEEAQALVNLAAQAEMSLAKVFAEVATFASEYTADSSRREDHVTLSRGARKTKSWERLETIWENARSDLQNLSEQVADLRIKCFDKATEVQGTEREQTLQFSGEVERLFSELRERMDNLSRVISEHSDDLVAWVARETRKRDNARVHTAPLSVAKHLQPIWNESHATVLTGATLATSTPGESVFHFQRERLGIEGATEAQYGSPFDYQKHCRIYLPTDAVGANEHEHNDYLAQTIPKLAEAAGGRTMVLFRSYAALNRVARQVRAPLEESGLLLLRQGADGAPARVVETFRQDPRSVLFGVRALWTGVDLPGDALSLLVVTRLPFIPPTQPVIQARSDQYDNPFMEFTIPLTVLEFRQGIGRLIRTQTDVGAIAILDGRMGSRHYGERFLEALPPAPIQQIPSAAIPGDLRRFLPPRRKST